MCSSSSRGVFFFAVVLLCFSAASSSPTPCEVPKQFMAHMSQTVLESSCAIFGDNGYIYYDYINQKLRLDVKGDAGENFHFAITRITDYNLGKTWDINHGPQGTCQSAMVRGRLSSPDLPPNSKYGGKVIVGQQDLDLWHISDSAHSGIDATVYVTQGTCALTQVTTVNTSTHEVQYSASYWNFIPEVPPYIFELPAECKNTKERRIDRKPDRYDIAMQRFVDLWHMGKK